MSGVTLAVAPRSEPQETYVSEGEEVEQKPLIPRAREGSMATTGGIMGSLRLIELQLVAFIMVFSASGLVPLIDVLFPAFTSVYILGLSRFVFRSHGKTSGPREIFRGSRLFRLYVMIGTAVGLFLPLAYVLGGFARGDDHAVRSATPHLFLLSFQILTENIISGLSLFSPPVRALVPLLYTTRRLFIILDWIKDVWVNKTLPANADLQNVAWFWFGRGLAVANLLYFSTNLFCFLIPRFLPRSFEKYFNERDELQSKMEEDKSSAAMNEAQHSTINKKAD